MSGGEAWDGQERRSHGERIAVLESNMERLVDPESGAIAKIEEKLDTILNERVKLSGMIGGVSLAVSGVVAVFSLVFTVAKEWIFAHLK